MKKGKSMNQKNVLEIFRQRAIKKPNLQDEYRKEKEKYQRYILKLQHRLEHEDG